MQAVASPMAQHSPVGLQKGRRLNSPKPDMLLRLQDLHCSTAEDLKRRGDACLEQSLFLQVCHGPGPGGTHVPLPEEQSRRSPAHRRCATRKNSRLW